MVQKKGVPIVVVVLITILVVGGAMVGLVIPALRGEIKAFSTPGSSSSGVLGTTNVGALNGFGNAASGGLSGGAEIVPTTTVFGTSDVATSTETMTASTTSASPGSSQAPTYPSSPTQATSSHDIEFFSNLTLNVSKPATSLQQASEIAASLGGYVAYSTYSESFATVTVRVPGQNYQAALGQLEQLGTLVSASSTSDDVSVQYADLNATLQSLMTEQTSLLHLLSQSNSVNATLDIESVLQKTDAQINSVESSILETGQLIDYATIGAVFQTSVPQTSVPLVARLSATPLTGMSPLSVTFNAVVSGGVQPYIVNFNFGDGTSAQGQQLIHQFAQAGRYNVTVSATDQSGNVSLAWVIVSVSSPPVASGLSAFGGYVWGLFSGVVEGIIEVGAVVLPIFAVLYVAVLPAYRRISKTRDGAQDEGEPAGD